MDVLGYPNIVAKQNKENHFSVKKGTSDKLDYVILNLFDTEDSWLPKVYFELVDEEIDFCVTDSLHNFILTFSTSDSLPIKLFEFSPERDQRSVRKTSDSTYAQLIWSAKEELTFLKSYSSTKAIIVYDGANEEYGYYGTDEKFTFGLQRINDDLIKCSDAGYERFSWVRTDTIDNQKIKFYEPNGSYSRTGVFDLKSDKWVIEPFQYDCFIGRRYSVVSHLVQESEQKSSFSEKFSILDENGEEVMHGVDKDTIAMLPWLVQDIYWELDIDTLYPCRNSNKIDRLPAYYYHYGDQMGVMRIANYGDDFNFLRFNEGDFAYANFEVGFYYSVVGDSIIVSNFQDTIWSGQMENFKPSLIFDINNSSYYDDDDQRMIFSTLMIKKNGELYDYEIIDSPDGSTVSYVNSSVWIDQNGRIVLSDSIVNFEWTQGYGYDGPNDKYITEIEGSAIWEKQDRVWTKVSPYYAYINSIPGGYICRTGGVVLAETEQNDTTFNDYIDPRYLILDNDLKPVSLIDYYDFPFIEDLGFGLKVCTDKGCMFVTYEGQAITSDDWDDFQLTSGKLTAIKNPEIKYDEFGSELPNSDGRVQVFELPKK